MTTQISKMMRVRFAEMGINARGFAKLAKMSESTLSQILTGANKEPDISTLKKLSKTSGIALVKLFECFYK